MGKWLRLTSFLLALAVFTAPVAAASAWPDTLFTTVDLMDATISELLAAMEDGRVTSETLTQMYLDRIAAYDDTLELNAVLALNPNALEEARAADRARQEGSTGRLLGIPFLVKDNIDVAGMATTAGSLSRTYAVASEDAQVVALLKAEGAVVLGKTNMAELALAGHNSRSAVGGITHNAYDLTRTPAGSSGGSAVAVTCNFAAFALGTDTGSSVRRPASFANLYSFRASFGLVSQSGLYRLNDDQDVIGPMCRSAEDMALLMEILAGSDENDPFTAEADSYLPKDGYLGAAADFSGLRIGYLANSFGYYYGVSGTALKHPTPLDEKIVPMAERMKAVFEDNGAEFVDISDLLTETDIAVYQYGADSYSSHLRTRREVTDILAENDIDAVMYLSQTDVAQLEPLANDDKNNAACYINIFAPLGGLPEVMLPMGFSETAEGFDTPLPLGISLFAGYGCDAVLLQIAQTYDALTSLRVQPSTTPALPDEALTAAGQSLLETANALHSADYTAKTADAVRSAARVLASTEPEAAAQYQAAAKALAQALDGLSPVETLACDETKHHVGSPDTASEEAPAQSASEDWKSFLLLGLFCASAAVFFLPRRKHPTSV